MTTQYIEYDTTAQQGEAGQVLGILNAAYPDHPWGVMVRGGVIFIRHLEHGFNYGMNLKVKNLYHDAAVFKREIIFMAGEWLERAGLARGAATGDEIIRIDGVPEKHQPNPKTELPMEVVVARNTEGVRNEPRPQVVKALVETA